MTAVIAQSSRIRSTTLPPVVTGFGICDDTVSSCAVVQKIASPNVSIPFGAALPRSNRKMSTAPTTSMASDASAMLVTRWRKCR